MTELFCLFFILLVPLAPAGLSLVHQGLGRSRSAAHTMLATLCALGIAAVIFVIMGSAFAGAAGEPAHILHLGTKSFDWLGAGHLFRDDLWAASSPSLHALMVLALQVITVGLVAIIPISSGGDRWRLGPICLFSAVVAAIIYPLLSHWIWGDGWLAQLPAIAGLPAFADRGGAAVVQVVAGVAALSVAWVLGPRRGKYSAGMATAIPGHNIVLILFGCLLALIGFTGLECAASTLFYAATPAQLAWTSINALLSASCGLLAAVLTTRLRYRKPDASISANGWVAGLVAGSAGCGIMSPGQTIFIGLIAGGLVTWMVETLEMDLFIDDPGGAISVHAGAGLWGLLAFGLLGPIGAETRAAHILTELIGIATLLGVALPLVHGINLLLNRFAPYRVDRDGDWQGMDIRELGSGAYPEFVVHADEFVPR